MSPTRTAIVLFAHGARDPRWADPLRRVAERIRSQQPGLAVELAFLELMSPDLASVAENLHGQGVEELRILPVFLGGSGHVLRDLPPLVSACQARFPTLRIRVGESVGQQDAVIRAIADVALDSRNFPG